MKRFFFPTLQGYQKQYLKGDLFSGILIAALSIPIAMGYAQIAGLPPVYGLYGSLLPIFLFAMTSTSPQFIFGVDAAPAAMIGSVLAAMGIAAGSKAAFAVVPVLTFYTGCWLLLFSLVRAGKAVKYISLPVMGGFITGICCEIILMQAPKLLGAQPGTGELRELLAHLWTAAKQCNGMSLLLGTISLALLLAGKKRFPRVPLVLFLLVAGALTTLFFHVDQYGVALLPAVTSGLPRLLLPQLGAIGVKQGLLSSLPAAVVILAETLLAERGYAKKNNAALQSDREILAFALGNLAAACTGCCAVNGSVSRTAVNVQNGGKTQLVSVVAAGTMVLILLFATPLIQFLPVPVLTAIVISALLNVTEFHLAKRLLRINRTEFFIFLGAFFGVLLLGAINGVGIGVVLSFVDVIIRSATPCRTFLGVLPGRPGFYPLERTTGAKPLPHVVLYQFSGALFFANIDLLEQDLNAHISSNTRAIIVDASAVTSVDISASDELLALEHRLRARGIRFYLTAHIGQVNDQLRRYGAGSLIERGAVHRTITAALLDAGLHQSAQAANLELPPELAFLCQLQEFEWAYGDDAEAYIEKYTFRILEELRQTTSKDRLAFLQACLYKRQFGDIDTDDLLLHLEGNIQKLSTLLGLSETQVLDQLEQKRSQLQERLAQEHPEALHYLYRQREKHEQEFRANHPDSAHHMDALLEQLRKIHKTQP